MSEVQTVSAAVHEIAHSKLHNYEKQKEDAAALLRKTEQNPFISGLLDTFDGVLTDVHHLEKEKNEEEF